MDHLIEAVRAEERRLLAKLDAVRNFLAAYERDGKNDYKSPVAKNVNENAPIRTVPPNDSAKPRTTRNARKSNSLTSRVEAAAIAYLENKGSRAQSQEILKAIIDQGFEFNMKNPVATLSSILSNSPNFDNVRGTGMGYGLTEWPSASELALGAESQGNSPPTRIATSNDQTNEFARLHDPDTVGINEVEPVTLLDDEPDGRDG